MMDCTFLLKLKYCYSFNRELEEHCQAAANTETLGTQYSCLPSLWTV